MFIVLETSESLWMLKNGDKIFVYLSRGETSRNSEEIYKKPQLQCYGLGGAIFPFVKKRFILQSSDYTHLYVFVFDRRLTFFIRFNCRYGRAIASINRELVNKHC